MNHSHDSQQIYRYRFLLIVLGCVVAMLFAGVSAGWAQEKVKLRYMSWVSATGASWIEEDFIQPFRELYPHIEIEQEYLSQKAMFEKLLTYIVAGNPPDIIHMGVGYIYEYADQGLVMNLQPWFDRDLKASDFFLEPMKAVRYPSMETGDLYAVPFSFVMNNLFYNKSMFDQHGVAPPNENWNWYDLRASARKLLYDKDGNGQPDQWGFSSWYGADLLDPVIHAWGGRILDDQFNVMVESPQAIAAAKFLTDMVREQGSPTLAQMGDQNTAFRTQKLGMYVGNMGDIATWRDLDGFDWNLTMIPAGPEKRVVRMAPDSFAIPTNSKHAKEAWEYIKFVITRRTMDRYSGARKVPIYIPLAVSSQWLEKDLVPDKMTFIRSIPYGHPLEYRPNWAAWTATRAANLRPA
jgi:multiple sugar transport system substrate-binding protein